MTWLLLSLACGGGSGPGGKDTADTASAVDTAPPTSPTGPGTPGDTYAFTSRGGTESSVAYTGQVLRHLLIVDLKGRIDGLTLRIDGGYFPEPGDVEQELNFYVDYDAAVGGSVPFDFATSLPPLQGTYGEVGDANLRDKLAGNDPEGQHVDWNATGIVGWPGSPTPEELVRTWIAEIDAAAVQRSLGTAPGAPDGGPLPSVAVSPEGLDRGQLLQKFLLGAIAFSQGADDYLDDDLPGKGLLADHSALEEGKPYTALEHQWDEGFGYFGAARDYGARSAAQVALDPSADTVEADGRIDLQSEVCWGHSANAAKRDDDAPVPADLMARSFEAFLAGRALLAETSGPLTDDQLAALQGHRDAAVRAWEEAIAATVIHYLNDTLQDYAAIGTPEHSFADQAKHWSELKGFALSFQFNPRSALSDSDFAQLHAWLGDAPVSPNASPSEVEAAAADLRAARDLCLTTWGFDAANAGDEDGGNGW